MATFPDATRIGRSRSTPYRLDNSSMINSVSPIGSPSSSIQGFLPFGPFRGLSSITCSYRIPASSSQASSLIANGPAEGSPQSSVNVKTQRVVMAKA
jgi:hypothetical protein